MRTLNELMNLKGRVALVTGGAGHIGLAVCESLMELGASVAVLDKEKKACDDRCKYLNAKKYQGKAKPIVTDLLKEDETRDSIHKTVKALGQLDIIVHTAAFVGTTKYPGWDVDFDKQTLDAWDACIRVNLSAAFLMTQEARPYLEKSGHGSVIFIASTYGVVGPNMNLYEGTHMTHPVAYGPSKAGLIHLAKYFATMFAPKIRVNTITPGGVWRNQPEKFHKRYKDKTPMGRMAIEEDFKGAVAYLASDLSNYVTGHNLVVDGGWTTW